MVQKTSFVSKLFRILEDEAYPQIRWASGGTSFLVLDSAALSSQVLPRVFKHNNYTSFVRQLNLYGFHKKNRSYHRNVPTEGSLDERDAQQHEPREFSHPQFLRHRYDLITEIRRKPTAAQQQQILQQRKESSVQSLTDSESSRLPEAPRSPTSPHPSRYRPYPSSARRPSASSSSRPLSGSQESLLMQAAAALPSRSSYASSSPVSPVQSMAPTTTQIALMHEMQSSMMKQISRLQGNVHHLSQQLRESRDKHEMLERQMVALRNVQQPQSRPRIPERLPGSPLPFSRNSAAERSPPPTLHSRSSGATSSFALPPPAALASFNPGERYHPYRQHSSDRPRGNFALPPLRDIDPDVRTGRRSPIEALSPWRS